MCGLHFDGARSIYVCYTLRGTRLNGLSNAVDLAHAGLTIQPFHKRGRPVAVIHYESEQAAREFLYSIMASRRGVGFLFGPDGSGKKTILRDFVRRLPMGHAAAIVDGAGLSGTDLLGELLSWFGRQHTPKAPERSFENLRWFLAKQAQGGRVPIIIIDDFDRMQLSGLRTLCEIASLKAVDRFSARLILVSESPAFNILNAQAMAPIARRLVSAFEMGPMTVFETADYLHAKLRAAGIEQGEHALPTYTCDELYLASHGWPGKLDDLAMRAIDRAKGWPLRYDDLYAPEHRHSGPPPDFTIVRDRASPDAQRLYLTLNRQTLQAFDLEGSKTLIGRSEVCDICINSRFVSKHHALLIRRDDAMLIVDLNSTNGTFLNSRPIESAILHHDDVISLGNHGIKLIAPSYRPVPEAATPDLAETRTMKTLDEMRLQKQASTEEAAPAVPRLVT